MYFTSVAIFIFLTKFASSQDEFFVVSTTENPNITVPSSQKVIEGIELKISAINKALEQQSEELKQLKKNQEEMNDNTSQIISGIVQRLEDEKAHKLPANCKEVMKRGISASGIYTIQPGPEAFTVLCDMETRGGGWTTIQKRYDGSQNFDLKWAEYKHGFGSLKSEFWLGLEYMYQLIGDSSELLVALVDKTGNQAYAYYNQFSIGAENENYKITLLNDFEGDAGNWLRNSDFSTYDHFYHPENRNCAQLHGGGWWFCGYSNLNGKYLRSSTSRGKCGIGDGINWYGFSGDTESLRKATMLVRPK